MCPQTRRMYEMVLIFCSPESPRMLFDRFWSTWSDDYKYKAERMSVTLSALDRSLPDIMDLQDVPFGGKVLILAGDFRQCLHGLNSKLKD